MRLSYTKKIIQILLFISFILVFNFNSSYSQDGKIFLNYDFCEGNVSIDTWYIRAVSGNFDILQSFKLYYTDINGNEIQILDFKWVNGGPNIGGGYTQGGYANSFYWKGESGNSISGVNSLGIPPDHPGTNPGSTEYIRFTWHNPPQNLLSNELKFKAVSEVNNNGIQNYTDNKSLFGTTYKGPDQPSSIEVKSDECSQVTINWANPIITCNKTKFTRIYRDGVHITDQNHPVNTFVDTGREPGKTYKYTLQSAFYARTGYAIFGKHTFEASGTPKGKLSSPSAAEATEERCDGKIKFSWGWFESAPDHFKIERSTTRSTGYAQIGGNITGGKRSYTDENVTKNTKYYYKITAYDGVCSLYGIASDTVMGIAPNKPAAPSNVATTQIEVSGSPAIKIDWTDNSVNETLYEVKRIFSSGGGERVFELDPDKNTFTDTEIENCIEYIYEVYAINPCAENGVKSTNTSKIQVNESISNTFDGITNKLNASKGYFTNRVELSWTNNNANLIDAFKIYRRVLGSSDAPVVIASQNSNASIYTDNTTEAGVLYEYFIIAEGSCGNATIYSNPDYTTAVSSIGFRSPSGIINGSISYTGGIAVDGAKVLVERAAGVTGKSIKLNGTNEYISIPHHASLMPTSEITLSAWVKPSALNNDMNIISKETINNGYRIYYKKSSNSVVFAVALNNVIKEVSATGGLNIGQYNNITASYDGSNIKIYIDGEVKGSQAASGIIISTNDPLYLGGNNAQGSFAGNIDEVLIFNVAKTATEIKRDFGRFLNESENGLVGYWRIEADQSPFIFDASKTGSAFNGNDGVINGTSISTMWTDDIPTGTQLGMVGITSSSGSYTVSNIRYNGVGENFTITPFFGVHEFNPGNKVLFIGDGSSVHNGQDFEDISSFKVTGSVKYKNTNIFVKDAFVKIDGELIIKAGAAIATDQNGSFEIHVPIGEHVITVEKGSHTFSAGRFPVTGLHDFQDVVSGIEFIDDTKRKIVGRVVGGTIEGDKKPGLGLSKNNIGKASMEFHHSGGGNLNTNTTDLFIKVETNPTTGEYSIELPPVSYLIKELKVLSNLTIDFGALEPLNISMDLPLITISDTTSNGTITSASFHKRNDYIHREPLNFEVTNKEGSGVFTGESEYIYTNPIDGTKTTVSLASNPFGFPIFQQGKSYKAKISVFEKYTNIDNGGNVEDKVPVQDAKISIFNALASIGNAANTEIIELTTGDTLYTFKTGNPNNAVDVNNSTNSYTKTFDILVEAGGHDKKWKDIRGGIFRGFVLGQKALGSSFTSQGPDVVNHILRDPPGSNSYAFLEAGNSYSNTTSWQVNTDQNLHLEKSVYAGAAFTAGIGVGVETKIENNIVLGTDISSSQNSSGEHVETVTVTEGFETNAESYSVGAESDLYIGRAMNMEFGLTNVISIVPDASANVANTDAYGSTNASGYRLVKKTGFFVVPGGYQTMFIYTQHHIINKLIPTLKDLRNSLLDGTNSNYTAILTDTEDSKFGSNNDDQIWGSSIPDVSTLTPTKTEMNDHNGKSYKYNGDLTKYGIATDSVRWYNQQIRLWEETIAKNEKEKVLAIAGGNPERNFSYSGGATFTYTHVSEKTSSETKTWEVGLNTEARLEIEAKVNGVGIGAEQSLSVSVSGGESETSAESNSTTYGYVMSDDQDEFFTIDTYRASDGNGPIFYTKSGDSSCPYEGETKTQFYQPGTVISKATRQREIPEISVATPKLVNIPADHAAVFTLTLTNNSASGDDMYYSLRVLASTNPNGAIIKVDGVPPNQTFLIPANSSINKTLTIEKGPIEIDYDSIQVLLHSPCQYDPTDADDNIESHVFLTAHFLPTCSPVGIIEPEQNWVVNNSYEDTLTVVVGDYDINYATLKNVQLQYKPSSEADWFILGTWWKDKNQAPNPNTADSIPQDIPYITYEWDLSSLPDGPFDIRSVAVCTQATIYSDVFSGLVDRLNPTIFGSASPADGILSPNDEIMIQFNEEIDETKLTADNFDIRGVLNGAEIRHNASVFFDGTGDHVAIDNMNLKRKSFTIEFWAKRLANGTAQTIFSQGNVTNRSIQIGFGADDKFTFKLQDEILSTTNTYTDGKWHHWAVTYDIENENAQIYFDGAPVATDNSFVTLYDTDGDITIGKSTLSPAQPYTGNIHGFRIWNRARSQSKIVANFLKKLSGKEGGLLANWRMDEGRGTLTEDIAKARHATVNAQWKLDPQGSAFSFDGTDNYLEVQSPLALTQEHDMTIEFWFKSANGINKTFLSNGKGDNTDGNNVAWQIGTNASGHIIVNNNGETFTASTSNHFDDKWHHFALVVNRVANTLAFVDGELKGSISSDLFSGFGGAKLWLGSRRWFIGVIENHDQYFNGKLDEVRIWSLARKQEQIKEDMNNKLNGDEIGLKVYYPFEKYTLSLGIYSSTEVLSNETENTTDVLTAKNGATYSTVTPNIKLPRPVQKLNFIYTTNVDKIILTPTDAPSIIENVILNITAKDVRDLHNNVLQSPITWTAFADRNQVSWEDQEVEFSKELNDALTFESKIVNTGGNIVDFEINNLPDWLSANPQSGEISPSSTRTISFTVNENVNIGNYEESIMLSTAFGFDERLDLKLNVSKTPPSNWVVTATDYQYSMSIVGQISVGGVISTDENDILAAFVNGEIRGLGNLKYVEALDQYEVFLSVYSNQTSGENLEFKIWNANEGLIHTQVTPDVSIETFQPDVAIGTPSSPITFSAVNTVLKQVSIPEGWKWISFNLTSSDLSNVNEILNNLDASNGDEVKDMMYFDKYDNHNGWIGTISSNGGFKNNKLYKLKLANGGTLEYEGEVANPLSHTIELVTGWNWIPFVSQRNMEISEALANLNPSDGDLIKGQLQFAIYDPALGWIGDLESLNPTEGYMIKVANAASFKFPKSGLYNGRERVIKDNFIKLEKENWQLNPYKFKGNMSLVATIDVHQNQIEVDDYLGAFIGEEIRGIAKPIYNSKTKQFVYFLTIYANELTENITFKLVNSSDDLEYSIKEIGAFQNNLIQGTINKPITLSLSDTESYSKGIILENELLSLYPNPFSDQLNIKIDLEHNTHLIAEVFNTIGQRVNILANGSFKAGVHEFNWSPLDPYGNRIPKGVYKIKITTPLFTKTKSVVFR